MHKIQNKRKMLIVEDLVFRLSPGKISFKMAGTLIVSRKPPRKNRKLTRVNYLICDISKYKNIKNNKEKI